MLDRRLNLSQEELWIFQYRIRPYLRYIKNDILRDRANDISLNIMSMSSDGKIFMLPANGLSNPWPQRLIDINHECNFRGIDITKYIDKNSLPYSERNLNIARVNSKKFNNIPAIPLFSKYGHREHMHSFLKHGRIRIAAASSFSSGEHNNARKDDEISFTTIATPFDYDLNTLDPALRELHSERGYWIIQHQRPCDYLIYCLSVSFSPRLFFDFEADSCVIIHNQDEFIKRLINKAKSKFPSAYIHFDAAKYVDPFFMSQRLPNEESIYFFIKHFKYAYQKEHRLVVSLHNGEKIGPFYFLEIGNIEDIATIVTLDS